MLLTTSFTSTILLQFSRPIFPVSFPHSSSQPTSMPWDLLWTLGMACPLTSVLCGDHCVLVISFQPETHFVPLFQPMGEILLSNIMWACIGRAQFSRCLGMNVNADEQMLPRKTTFLFLRTPLNPHQLRIQHGFPFQGRRQNAKILEDRLFR